MLVILIVIGLLVGLHFGYQYYAFEYRYKNEEPAKSNFTNDYSLYDDSVINASIRQYEILNGSMDLINEDNSYIIPGLLQTRTVDVNGKEAMCTSMTPQGICISEKYLFISAYCHTHQHNSVIYMMDRESHQFIKEIILDGQYHLGNICYDPVNRNLWAACTGVNNATNKKCAYLNCINMDYIESYNFDEVQKPLYFSKKYALAEYKNASFISYYSGNIFVGVYYEGLWNNSYVQRFPINEQGGMNAEVMKTRKGTQRVVYGKEKAKISECCQGFYFTSDILFLMQSSGTKDSSLQLFVNTQYAKDVEKMIQLDKEYRVYSDKKRVADTFTEELNDIDIQIDELEDELTSLKELQEKQKKEKDKDKKKNDEEEEVTDQMIEDKEAEIQALKVERVRIQGFYENAAAKVPQFNETVYFALSRGTREYTIENTNTFASLTFPPRLEQAMVSELDGYSNVYLLFESAAYSYRAQTTTPIDRVLILPLE